MRDDFGSPRRTRIETDLTSADVDPASLIPNSTILIVSVAERVECGCLIVCLRILVLFPAIPSPGRVVSSAV